MNTPTPAPATEVTLTVAAVARRLGVEAATIRTWAKRYGIGPQEHVPGTHRRFTLEDLARLEAMRKLVHSGVPVAEAAKAACDCPAADFDTLVGRVSRPVAELPQVVGLDAPTPELSRLAAALDGPGCQRLIAQHIIDFGAQRTWLELLVPVLTGVGDRWQATGRGIEVEHVLSDAVTAAFNSHIARLSRPENVRPVLMAAAPEESHVLGMLATAAVLSEHKIGVRMLGQRVPYSALASAIQRVGPCAVFVWSQVPGTGDAAALAELPQLRPSYRLILAGSGWEAGWPESAVRVGSMPAAIAELVAAAA